MPNFNYFTTADTFNPFTNSYKPISPTTANPEGLVWYLPDKTNIEGEDWFSVSTGLIHDPNTPKSEFKMRISGYVVGDGTEEEGVFSDDVLEIVESNIGDGVKPKIGQAIHFNEKGLQGVYFLNKYYLSMPVDPLYGGGANLLFSGKFITTALTPYELHRPPLPSYFIQFVNPWTGFFEEIFEPANWYYENFNLKTIWSLAYAQDGLMFKTEGGDAKAGRDMDYLEGTGIQPSGLGYVGDFTVMTINLQQWGDVTRSNYGNYSYGSTPVIYNGGKYTIGGKSSAQGYQGVTPKNKLMRLWRFVGYSDAAISVKPPDVDLDGDPVYPDFGDTILP